MDGCKSHMKRKGPRQRQGKGWQRQELRKRLWLSGLRVKQLQPLWQGKGAYNKRQDEGKGKVNMEENKP